LQAYIELNNTLLRLIGLIWSIKKKFSPTPKKEKIKKSPKKHGKNIKLG
jgi:hypothetical protein